MISGDVTVSASAIEIAFESCLLSVTCFQLILFLLYTLNSLARSGSGLGSVLESLICETARSTASSIVRREGWLGRNNKSALKMKK